MSEEEGAGEYARVLVSSGGNAYMCARKNAGRGDAQGLLGAGAGQGRPWDSGRQHTNDAAELMCTKLCRPRQHHTARFYGQSSNDDTWPRPCATLSMQTKGAMSYCPLPCGTIRQPKHHKHNAALARTLR